jgi:WD40 repeat protein
VSGEQVAMSSDVSHFNFCKSLQGVQVHPSDTTILLSDAMRAVLTFFTPLSKCAAQIYFSVLPLMPNETLLREVYGHECSSVFGVLGMETHWNSLIRVINTGNESITSVSLSFDGTRIASASSTGVIQVWDVDTGELKITGPSTYLDDREGRASVAWTPDGRILSGNDTVVIWEADTMVPERTFYEYMGPVVVSYDGTVAIMNSYSGDVIVLDTTTWQQKLRFPHYGEKHYAISHTYILFSALNVYDMGGVWRGDMDSVNHSKYFTLCSSISPDGQFIAQYLDNEGLWLWNHITGECRLLFRRGSECYGHVNSLAFSPDSTHIAGGCDTIHVWRISTGDQVVRLMGHTKRVFSLAFSRDGAYLVSGSEDGTIKIWDWRSNYGEPGAGDELHISALAISPDGSAVISGSKGRTTLWEVRSGERKEFGERESSSMGVAFSPDGRHMATTNGFEVAIWDVRTRTKIDTALTKCGYTFSGSCWGAVALSPDNRLVASMHNSKFEIWDRQRKKLNHIQPPSPLSAYYATFSPDGGRIACATNMNINIYTTEGCPILQYSFRTQQVSRWLSFSHDGTRIMNETESFDIPPFNIPTPQRITAPGVLGTNTLHVLDGWVIDMNGNRQCWVPEAYRGHDIYASQGNILALGGTNGRVMFLYFN